MMSYDFGIVLHFHLHPPSTLMTTEECLLRRNPRISKQQYEALFRQTLGITKVCAIMYTCPYMYTNLVHIYILYIYIC